MEEIVESPPAARLSRGALLHVTNGDVVADTLRRSGLPGSVAIWADVLHEGPVTAAVSDDEWIQARARYLASSGYTTFEEALETHRRWDAALARFPEFDEVVLWFEHDLFDQLILIRLLDWFGRRRHESTRISLICIGAFPGIERFAGLGQLTPEQLASLIDTRTAVSDQQTALAHAAWAAFSSADPMAIESIVAADTSALPFLSGAFVRHLEEFPSVQDGLGRTEHQAMQALAGGVSLVRDLFHAVQRTEERIYMGDGSFWGCLRQLGDALHPLVRLDGTPPTYEQSFSDQTATLTANGREVLAGRLDAVRLNGIDRWLGGVHLHGPESPWRWDRARHRLVRAGAALLNAD